MDLPGGTPRRLSSGRGHGQVPGCSSDGQGIAYVTWPEDGGTLMKVRADGRGAPVRLTPDVACYDVPVWSPDGQKVVFVKGPRAPRITEHFGPGYELDWVPAVGGAATRVTPYDGWGRPHFGRDPNRIFYYAGPEGLVSIRFDGTDRRAYLKGPGNTYRGPGSEPQPADEILVGPDTDRVLAQAGNNVYLVTQIGRASCRESGW